MGSSPVPPKTHRVGQRCTLNLSRAEMSSRWCGVVVRRGVPAQVSSMSLDHGSKLRDDDPRKLEEGVRCFPFETGICYKRKTNFFPEEDTTMSYSGFEREPSRRGIKVSIINRTDYSNTWILSDCRNAVQHLQDWTHVDDLVSILIINKLKTIAKYRDVHFQWIPSHVNVPGNEVADFLAKRGCSEIATTNYALTYREIYFLMTIKGTQFWIAPPDHPGTSRKSPGGALEFDGNRKHQTAVSRLLSGHLKGLTFESGRKVFHTCSKCHLLPVSPEHILNCLRLAL
ncbi:replication factor C subunit 3 [Trichonephila clavipes]|nr:replication factor C subunit 3 [Trichonephila clavipes]